MRLFATLFVELDASTSTRAKVDALKRYFAAAAPRDAAWAVYFLAGGKPRQVVPTAMLRTLACRIAGIEDWLFEACYQAVGDLAETIAQVLPPALARSELGLADWIEERLLPLRAASADEQAERIAGYWNSLDTTGRFLLIKLIGGGFRVGVSKLLVQRALAEHAGIDAKLVAQRMMGYTDAKATPDALRYVQLSASAAAGSLDAGQPYPFFLAHSLDWPLAEFAARLDVPADWLIEWKYDGIRAQVVKRAGQVWVWSRGEELVTERFPEVVALAARLANGTVLDGEIVVWKEGAPAPFNLLQQRIGRKTLTKKVLADAPVGFIAYDLLEWQGTDVRERPQFERRALLEALLAAAPQAPPRMELSPLEAGDDWIALATLREQSRSRGVEGFMLKHRLARYGTGRRKQDDIAAGTWWKWKR
ncbi:MAG TPA: cisplatin damage response ATP-dependent DNA ligase, partial [Caldimonas sp.]